MAKQTAVEWLQECLDLHLNHEQKMQYEGLFQQAKNMEKEQIMKAFSNGQERPINHPTLPHYSREEYYNETFEK